MFASIAIVTRYVHRNRAIVVLSVCLTIQVIDFYPGYSKHNLETQAHWQTTLKSDFWNKIANNVDHVALIPPEAAIIDPEYTFSLYAADNGLTINLGYVARENIPKMIKF